MGKVITNPTSDRELISKICKELQKLGTEIQNNQIKIWDIELRRTLIRRISNGQTFKELLNILNHQGNAIEKNTPVKMAKIKNTCDSLYSMEAPQL